MTNEKFNELSPIEKQEVLNQFNKMKRMIISGYEQDIQLNNEELEMEDLDND